MLRAVSYLYVLSTSETDLIFKDVITQNSWEQKSVIVIL